MAYPGPVSGSEEREVLHQRGARSGAKWHFGNQEFETKDLLSVLNFSQKQTPGLGGRRSAKQEGMEVLAAAWAQRQHRGRVGLTMPLSLPVLGPCNRGTALGFLFYSSWLWLHLCSAI